MMAAPRYVPCSEDDVPSSVRFDTPRSCQGQAVVVSYADWPTTPSEAGPGSLYRRTVDRSDLSITFARLAR